MSAFPKSPGEAFPTLTVNSRLARWLLLEHNEKQNTSGLKVWPTPEILPLTSWLKQVWTQSWPEKYILTELQSQRLWGEIVQQDPRPNISNLLHLNETAKRAAEAHSLTREHRLPEDDFFPTEESIAFNKWKTIYQNRLKRLGALDPAEAMDEVRSAMLRGDIPIPKGIVFAGFEEISPQFQVWLNFLKNQGVSIRFDPEIPGKTSPPLKSMTSGKNIEVREFTDKKNEAVQCARWVRANYQPGKKIGVVVIDLASYRSLLNRELRAELAPASVYPWMERELPFNISLGPTLWEEPMIHSAAQILSIHSAGVPLQTFTSVIRSPYLNVGQTQSFEVHALENKLFKKKYLTVYLAEVNALIAPGKSSQLIELAESWKNHVQEKENRLPSEWAAKFSIFFKSLGWPGAGRTLTSREFQVYEAWKSCLDEFAALDSILEKVPRRKAVETLLSMLREHPFQEKTRDQPIQVVGLLESSGMRFDHLWVMGCTADVLPALPSPNPFLPIEIRRRHDLPHSSAQRELEFAENSLRRLVASSSHLVFSYPAQKKNVELKISPLIAALGAKPIELDSDSGEGVSHRLVDQFPLEPDLEFFQESSLLPVTECERRLFEDTGPGGGYGFLKNQAECPFRSFAHHRLNAKKEEFPELDFDHQERGTLVHKALEIFWQQTRTQDGLLKLQQEGRLEKAVRDSVRQALKKQEGTIARQNLFYQLELQRVHNLMLEWLNEEIKRPPFEVVDLEKEEYLEISGMKIRLRIDRIDKTEGGKIVLIDYKTGKITFADWFGERIQEPQLPLYAFKTPPDAVAFAQVKKGNAKLQGAFDPSRPIPGVFKISPKHFPQFPTWEEQLEDWRMHLTAMADEFLAGQTQVNPLKGVTTCKYCDLQSLCRIAEKTQSFPDAEEDE